MSYSIPNYNNEPNKNKSNTFKDENLNGKLIFFNGVLGKIDGYNTRNLKFQRYTQLQKTEISIDISLLTCGEHQTYYKFKNELQKKAEHVGQAQPGDGKPRVSHEHIPLKDIKFSSTIFDYSDEAFNKIFITTTKNNEEQLQELINDTEERKHIERTVIQRDMAGISRCENMSKGGTNDYYSKILKELSDKFKASYMEKYSTSDLLRYFSCEHQRNTIIRLKEEWQRDGLDTRFNQFMERQRELQRSRDAEVALITPSRRETLEPAQ